MVLVDYRKERSSMPTQKELDDPLLGLTAYDKELDDEKIMIKDFEKDQISKVRQEEKEVDNVKEKLLAHENEVRFNLEFDEPFEESQNFISEQEVQLNLDDGPIEESSIILEEVSNQEEDDVADIEEELDTIEQATVSYNKTGFVPEIETKPYYDHMKEKVSNPKKLVTLQERMAEIKKQEEQIKKNIKEAEYEEPSL